MKSLKILHSESSRGWGGQEVRTLKEMVALRDLGHVVELVCPSDARIGARSAELGFAVHHARMRGGGDVRSMTAIKALLRSKAFDVLNTHSGHDSLVAGMAGRLAGTPLVVRTRHLALPISSLATYTWIPHRVIAVSRYVRQYLISAGVAAGRVQTIYDGIPTPEPIVQSTLRAELGLGPDALIGCMVAIMRDKKGHEDLIAAAEPLFATQPNLHIVMAGDGDTFARIKELVERRGLAQRIHLLGFRTDIPNVLRGCDLFVLPTHQEALGQSYIEAMAAGLPVIGTHVDGVPELITQNVNGLLVPAKDTQALRAAIVQLIDDPELRARLGAEGRRITEQGFTIGGMADETVDFYRRSLSERSARA
ncbi:glycosyl transferase family 1 [Caballeronia choica]|uniref:Glycosyl transferase family 1 n=1 Tax=Caballeronia choica TaxID=326476 RepID=A0A158KKH2_9BURK|nr:glycosyltransferase family 4 protein [Caballeronia choica]SAL81243.1 glycosyl transferase family 1 [Caballeronia choica]